MHHDKIIKGSVRGIRWFLEHLKKFSPFSFPFAELAKVRKLRIYKISFMCD